MTGVNTTGESVSDFVMFPCHAYSMHGSVWFPSVHVVVSVTALTSDVFCVQYYDAVDGYVFSTHSLYF